MSDRAPLWKPNYSAEAAKRERQERQREIAIIAVNRATVARRDGRCRLGTRAARLVFDACAGRAEWNHLTKRSKSDRDGATLEEKHATGITMMACSGHHQAIDQHRISFEYLTDRRADGQMKWKNEKTGATYEER